MSMPTQIRKFLVAGIVKATGTKLVSLVFVYPETKGGEHYSVKVEVVPYDLPQTEINFRVALRRIWRWACDQELGFTFHDAVLFCNEIKRCVQSSIKLDSS